MTSPNNNDSWEMHEEMLKNSEDFYQQVSSAVSGFCLQGVHFDVDNVIHMVAFINSSGVFAHCARTDSRSFFTSLCSEIQRCQLIYTYIIWVLFVVGHPISSGVHCFGSSE